MNFFSFITCVLFTCVICIGNVISFDVNPHFAVFSDLQNSLLPQMKRAYVLQNSVHIRYPFCVIAREPTTESNILSWATASLNKWNVPLIGQPNWSVQSIETYQVVPNNGICPVMDNGLRVYEIAVISIDGGWNYAADLKMALGNWGVDSIVVMHELGHGIGLADIYGWTGREPLQQPSAAMNNVWATRGEITQDDIDGIRFVWSLLNGNAQHCPNGYKTGQLLLKGQIVEIGTWNEYFCIKCDHAVDPNCTKGNDDTSGCKNTHENCEYWASRGECAINPDAMLINCCKACSEIDPVDTCVNNNANCESWASIGECTRNPDYMLVQCCDACKNTDNTCIDQNSNCAYWASNNECARNPGYMLTNCCKSCKSGTGTDGSTCIDQNTNCVYWANNNECARNPSYMSVNCCKSCIGK